MARAALLGRVSWRVGTVVAVRDETSTARTLVLKVPGWPGHDAGQHVDVRLTAPDGYSAVRSYSIASAPASASASSAASASSGASASSAASAAGRDAERVELTVEQLPDGEVSPYLARVVSVGDPLEVRGPVGGWFVWRPGQVEPVQLVAGGSGVVPLMAMVRTHADAASRAPLRLLYSVRDPDSVLYRAELQDRAGRDGGLDLTYAYTRRTPAGWHRPAERIDAGLIAAAAWSAELAPTCYVCGPTGFVETAADLLIGAGHDPSRIRTERFGPSGGPR
jgi:ferredoxin-NADP reductase